MKQTIEEAANDYLQKILEASDFEINFEEDNYDAGARDAVLDVTERAFKAGADWQAKQSSWISIDEGLPEKDGYYLVTGGEIISIAYFLKCFNKFAKYRGYPFTFYENNAIKAYIPIPSFDEILEVNKDVSQRIKEKGD